MLSKRTVPRQTKGGAAHPAEEAEGQVPTLTKAQGHSGPCYLWNTREKRRIKGLSKCHVMRSSDMQWVGRNLLMYANVLRKLLTKEVKLDSAGRPTGGRQ